MPVTTALIAGGAGTVAGGLMGYLTRPDLSASTNSAKLQALTALINRPPEIPEIELQKYSTPEALTYLGNFTPEELQATGLPSGVINQAMRSKQLQALGGYEQLSQTGLSAIDRAALSEIQNQIATQEKGQRESILQNMAQRGLSGSGQELAAQLQSSQAASQLASQQGMQQAAQAQQARVNALSNLSNMASGIEQTDFQRQAQKAQAQDVINQFNVQNRNTAGLRNLQTQQDIANMNAQERNRIAQANADLMNKQIMQNQVNRPLAQYGLQTDYTSALGQGIGGIGQTQTQQQLANQQAMSQGLGTGLTVGGTVAGAALTGKK
ncbi:hypothetical protein EB001_25215 [bacterium]|nr:hypothetical protein [bacterium]